MASHKKTVIGSSIVPFRMVFLMWLVYAVLVVYGIDLAIYGVYPRTKMGVVGIVLSPMLHGSLTHLISNTFPLLFLGAIIFYFYDLIAYKVFYSCYLVTNVFVWAFARSANHIGASGLIYGLAFFLIFFGIFRRDKLSILLSVIIIFTYGSLFYGLFPSEPGVSWESHLFGGVVGTINAVWFSNRQQVSS